MKNNGKTQWPEVRRGGVWNEIILMSLRLLSILIAIAAAATGTAYAIWRMNFLLRSSFIGESLSFGLGWKIVPLFCCFGLGVFLVSNQRSSRCGLLVELEIV